MERTKRHLTESLHGPLDKSEGPWSLSVSVHAANPPPIKSPPRFAPSRSFHRPLTSALRHRLRAYRPTCCCCIVGLSHAVFAVWSDCTQDINVVDNDIVALRCSFAFMPLYKCDFYVANKSLNDVIRY